MSDLGTTTLLDDLVREFARTCRVLGEAGHPQAAARHAAAAWSLLHRDHPQQAMRLDGAMHYLARLEAQLEASTHRKDSTMTDVTPDLDVRTEAPARRHQLIFETYGALAPGAAFVLVNDHDPKPLYYQFEAEHAGAFSWSYLEEGPTTWRVQIGRTGDSA